MINFKNEIWYIGHKDRNLTTYKPKDMGVAIKSLTIEKLMLTNIFLNYSIHRAFKSTNRCI